MTLMTKRMHAWARSCLIIKPATLLGWHRKIAAWTWTTRKPGRKKTPLEVRNLILQIKRENTLWGPKRINGELLKLGFTISETTVRTVLRKYSADPWDGKPPGTWRNFFQRHQRIWGIDFFTVHSAFMQRMFVFVVMDLHSRELVSIRMTLNPTAEWVQNVLRGELMDREAPEALIHDRDPAFDNEGFRALLASSGAKDMRCPRRSPLANAFVERLNGTLQRECTDHFLFLNERQLQRALNDYREYYNRARCHQGLDQRTPLYPKLKGVPRIQSVGQIAKQEFLAGLHHEYFWAA